MSRSVVSNKRSLLSRHRWFVVIVIVFVGLATWYNIATPMGESDNESSHFGYIQFIQVNRALPTVNSVLPAPPQRAACYLASSDDVAVPLHQFRQPPLYYALNAVVFSWLDMSDTWWPDSNYYAYLSGHPDGGENAKIHDERERFPYQGGVFNLHLVRFLSTLIGVAGLFALYLTGRLLFEQQSKTLPLLFTISVAFIPTYLFAAAVVNNDILVGVLGMWSVYFCLRALMRKEQSDRAFLAATVLFVLALLTKYNAIFLLPFLLLTLIVLAVRHWREGAKGFLRWVGELALFSLLLLPLPLWWLNRNQQTSSTVFAGYPGLDIPLSSKLLVLTMEGLEGLAGSLWASIKFTFLTYWGLLGADVLFLPSWLLVLFTIALVFIGLGIIKLLLDRRVSAKTKSLIVWTVVAATLVWSIFFFLFFFGPRGRYLLPLYSLFGVLMFWGASAWGTRRWPFVGAYLLAGLVLLAGFYAPLGVIVPAYAAPERTTEVALQPGEQPVHAYVDDFAELVAIRIIPESAAPFEPVDVTLVWRVLKPTSNNYVVGVHMEGADQAYFGGVTHFPAKGDYATSLWQPGEVFRDTYRLYVESGSTAPLPTAGRVKVSMYCPTDDGDIQLPVYDEGGTLLGEEVYSEPIRLGLPAPAPVVEQESLLATFGNEIGLVGVEGLDEARPGEALPELQFEWQALVHPTDDYTVYLHVIDEQGRQIAAVDYPLTNDYYPSSLWLPGERVLHKHPLDITTTRMWPSGRYELVIGLYDVDTGRRLALKGGENVSERGYTIGVWEIDNHFIYAPYILSP